MIKLYCRIRAMIAPILIILAVTSLSLVIKTTIERQQIKSDYEALNITVVDNTVSEEAKVEPVEEVKEASTEISAETEEIKVSTVNVEIPTLNASFEALKNINNDLVGIIYVPEIDICYPVVQGKDNEEYLHKSFEGKKCAAGTLFMNASANADLSSLNTMIYGHDMKNKEMFGRLDQMISGINNSSIYFYTETNVYVYEVLCVNVIDAKEDASLYIDVTEENYEAYIRKCLSNATYKNANIDKVSNLLTLAACYGSNKELVTATLIGNYSYTQNN